MAKPYKHRKRGGAIFVQLHEWVQASDAWASLKPGPRALYIELKRRHTGTNNGAIFLSHRDAAKALNVGRDTAANYFTELKERGFIVETRGHCLGPSGKGQSATYALSEERLNEKPASRDFQRWKK